MPSPTTRPASRIAIILVHGIGSQQRYEYLKEASSAFYDTLRSCLPHRGRHLSVNKRELSRGHARSSEASDALPWRPAGVSSAETHASLFCPVHIAVTDAPHSNSTVHHLHFYEAYWADADLQYTWPQKLRFTCWLTLAMWNPLFNICTGHYAPDTLFPSGPTSWLVRLWRKLRLLGNALTVPLLIGPLYHLGEALFLLLSLGRLHQLSRRWNNLLHEYAGDIRLYVSERRFFHNQEKRDVIRARFDEVLIKALTENDEVHVIGHSLGSAIAFDGLTRHVLHLSKMSEDFREFLDDQVADNGTATLVRISTKLKTLVTLGSPMDKLYFFFPWRRSAGRIQPDFSIRRTRRAGEHQADLELQQSTEPAAATCCVEWYNFSDVVDPVGARLDYFRHAPKFCVPTNYELARAFLPFEAHGGYWRNKQFLEWIVRRVCPGEVATGPSAPGRRTRLGRQLLVLLYFAAFGGAMVYGARILFTLVLGVLEDFHTNAESHTAYVVLQPLAVALQGVREHLALVAGATPAEMVGGLTKIASYFWGVSLLWSGCAYARRQRRRPRPRREE